MVLVQFVLLAMIWGSGFLFLEVSVKGLSPAQVVVGRMLVGATTLLIILAVTRQRFPRAVAVWGIWQQWRCC